MLTEHGKGCCKMSLIDFLASGNSKRIIHTLLSFELFSIHEQGTAVKSLEKHELKKLNLNLGNEL